MSLLQNPSVQLSSSSLEYTSFLVSSKVSEIDTKFKTLPPDEKTLSFLLIVPA